MPIQRFSQIFENESLQEKAVLKYRNSLPILDARIELDFGRWRAQLGGVPDCHYSAHPLVYIVVDIVVSTQAFQVA
jgi:hypothetical protein